jgi:hypothetical protein
VPDVPSLEAKRWEKTTDPNAHKPIEALRAAIRGIESGEINPDHIVVVYHDNKDGTGYFQAGEFSTLVASMGLLTRCVQIMGES